MKPRRAIRRSNVAVEQAAIGGAVGFALGAFVLAIGDLVGAEPPTEKRKTFLTGCILAGMNAALDKGPK